MDIYGRIKKAETRPWAGQCGGNTIWRPSFSFFGVGSICHKNINFVLAGKLFLRGLKWFVFIVIFFAEVRIE